MHVSILAPILIYINVVCPIITIVCMYANVYDLFAYG